MKVAVIDSGVLPEHVKVAESKDFSGFNVITNPHGTYVAKIIRHFAPGAQIISLKVGHAGNDITEGSVLMALDYAVEKGADVINMSIGGLNTSCNGDCIMCDYVNKVVELIGATVVVAAGNAGRKGEGTVTCPGKAQLAVTVGEMSPNGGIAETSGKGLPGSHKPNIIAPGNVRVFMKTSFDHTSGTSFATPVITGVLANLIPKFGKKSWIVTKMYETSRSIGLPRHHEGFGCIDLDRMVEVISNDPSVHSTSSGQN